MSLNIFVSQQHVQTLQIRAKNRNVCGGIASTSECERMRSRDIGDILKTATDGFLIFIVSMVCSTI